MLSNILPVRMTLGVIWPAKIRSLTENAFSDTLKTGVRRVLQVVVLVLPVMWGITDKLVNSQRFELAPHLVFIGAL